MALAIRSGEAMPVVLPLNASAKLASGASSVRLGERLLREKRISKDQIQIALHEQRRTKERLGDVLVKLGFIDDETLANFLAAHTGHDRVDLKEAAIDADLLNRVPRAVAERCRIVPLSLDKDILILAMADPLDIGAMDEIRRYFPRQIDIVPRVAMETDIAETLRSNACADADFDALLDALEGAENPVFAPQDKAEGHPLVRLVDRMLADAVREGASDIHLEPESTFVRFRLRIDGILRQIRALHLDYWPQLSHRLKIMAGMNIADTRSMQDGRFHMQINGAEIDFRMAVMPTVFGENIVIRILDHRRALLPLDKLGYDAHSLQRLSLVMDRPEGIVLVTGPTGCGKTTTLYAMLRRLSDVSVNIMTLEDPVEYQFDLIRQTAVQEEQGIGFAEGVRGLLRQAPDIVFVGEIRDSDTARMALRAAMTGHQVFSTLHCNDSFGALPRLADLGLSIPMISQNIVGIVAQRLVRTLCPLCKRARPASAEERTFLGVSASKPALASYDIPGFSEAQSAFDAPFMVAEATGCPACSHTGYRGRSAVVETLSISPEIEELIAKNASRTALMKQARKEGFTSMAANGIAKLLRQETSLDELRRNVDMTRGV